MLALELATVLFVGLALGSFSTALVYRVPRGMSWWSKDRSQCPACQNTLTVRDLIPVFSWLSLKGKCRHCGAKILPRYPLVELATVIGCLGAYAAYGLTPNAFFIMAAVPFLMALLVIDLDHLILPDQLVLILGGIGLLRVLYLGIVAGLNVMMPFLVGAILYALMAWLLGVIMTRVMKKDALGFGDVKFFAVAGLWLGAGAISWFLLLSGILGVAMALIWRKMRGESVFPFGPALILSLYVILVIGGSLLP